MKKILFILLASFFYLGVESQTLPNYAPTVKSNAYYRIGWMEQDSGAIWGGSRDTSFRPLNNNHAVVFWQQATDSSFWYFTGQRWINLVAGSTIANYYTQHQSDSIFLRKSDTAAMLSNYFRKSDTTQIINKINTKADTSTTITINGVKKTLGSYPVFTIATSDTTSLSNRINAKVDTAYNGQRPFTGSVLTGQNPNTTSVKGLLDYVFYPSQPPIAGLSGGTNLQFTAAGTDTTVSINYSMTVQTSTQIPVSVLITSSNGQSYNKGSFSSTTSGTQNVTVPRNTNVTFYNTSKASDGKTSTASTSFNWYNKFYYGFVSNTSPSDLAIQAMNGYLASSKNQSGSVSAPATAGYIAFAYPTSFGALSSITINTFLQPSSNFNVTTRSFTNEKGYTTTYYIIVFTTTTGGGYSFSIN